jgi:hypothetical protein
MTEISSEAVEAMTEISDSDIRVALLISHVLGAIGDSSAGTYCGHFPECTDEVVPTHTESRIKEVVAQELRAASLGRGTYVALPILVPG